MLRQLSTIVEEYGNLFSIKQEGEMLWSYVACINAVTLEVKYFNEYGSLSTLKRELQSSCLSFFLDKNFSRNYVDFLVHVRKYIQAEKSYTLHQKKEA